MEILDLAWNYRWCCQRNRDSSLWFLSTFSIAVRECRCQRVFLYGRLIVWLYIFRILFACYAVRTYCNRDFTFYMSICLLFFLSNFMKPLYGIQSLAARHPTEQKSQYAYNKLHLLCKLLGPHIRSRFQIDRFQMLRWYRCDNLEEKKVITNFAKSRNAPFQAVWKYWISSIIMTLLKSLAHGIIKRTRNLNGCLESPTHETTDDTVNEIETVHCDFFQPSLSL